jgi:uncharacterized protein with ParB-like and HNH nuclease domain
MQVITANAFEPKGIGTLLKSGRLKVPPNQREYSWESKHIADLFQDFQNAIRNNQSHFLGTIVVARGSKNIPEIVDGQQRLATTTILLAAIRDYFFNANQKTLQDSIDNEFLFQIDRDQVDIVPKLSLNTSDNEYFKNRIIAHPKSPERESAKPSKESHKRIDFAAQKAETLVQNLIVGQTDFRNIKDILNQWVDFIEFKASIIHITVPDEMNAFMMFETLNDRGLKTSQADLVKNYLFHEATEERIIEAQQKWLKMVATLETLGIEDIVMTYLRHLLITLYGPTREKEIFEKIQNQIHGRAPALTFLDKLSDYADTYAAILTPTHAKWNEYVPTLPDAITILRDLKVQQIRPLMLSVAHHFDKKEAEIAFRAFICWTVRFLIAGGMRGGQLEDAYGQRASDVANQEIKNTRGLLKSLVDVIPSDGIFQEAFSTVGVTQHNLARYYLRAIEAYLRKDENKDPELMPAKETTILNLEHIIPMERGNNWSHIDDDTADAYTNRLGNMTLLRSKTNAKFGNYGFRAKREEFKKSPILITKEIYSSTKESTKWGREEINARQERLAGLAVKTWPLFPRQD